MRFRRAHERDIPSVAHVYREALRHVYHAHGFDAFLPLPGVNPFYAHACREEPEGFHVAEDNGVIVAAAISWVREHLWFLSHLFVLPEYQGQGIGKKLLALCQGYARTRQCTHRAVITMSFNPVSLALYVKNGMYPRDDVLLLSIDPPARISGDLPGVCSFEPIAEADQATLETLAAIDGQTIGIRRDGHHRFFLSQPDARLLLARRGEVPEGYMYVWESGRIGPLAAPDEAVLLEMTRHAFRQASSTGATITLMVPASNTVTLREAIDAGCVLDFSYTLLCSGRFGPLDHYVAHSPGLM